MWGEHTSIQPFSPNERHDYLTMEHNYNDEESVSDWLQQEFAINDWLEREDAILDSTDMQVSFPSQSYHSQNMMASRVPVFPSASMPITQVPTPPMCKLVPNPYTQPQVSNVGGILRPCSEIPSPFENFFKFGVFNRMQSECVDDAFYSDTNLTLSAPTSSGKTVVMELAILRLLLKEGMNSKIIYMAPTKSLCSERFYDWGTKFQPYKINCQLFTGDSDDLSIDSLRTSQIIVTTPEKWDNSTRKWKDHRQFMEMIKLFLIDEVHILNENRGAVLEVCVSRMMSTHKNIRFIAVSATVPNIDDVAQWLNAKKLSFSEEYRPIQLQRFVYGYRQEENMFSFERKLAWKLLEKIQTHSDGKSTLVFCATRASCQATCETLVQTMDRNNIFTLGQKSSEQYTFKNKFLLKFAKRGVLFHHAGLSAEDRREVERLFIEKKIRVIATTSTLAVGVNLPAYMVVIKSTQGYQDGKLSEYSDINFLQMVGRAGRPGLDTAGCVIVMTTKEMEKHYTLLVSGSKNLESNLHIDLTEHLMSEIYLGTVNGTKSGLEWLFSTFLCVRLLKNPHYYKLACTEGSQYSMVSPIDALTELLLKNLDILEKNKLIARAPDGTIKHTEYGAIMSKYYVKLETMISIINSQSQRSIKDPLLLVSSTHEMSHLRINSGEKTVLNTLKKHPDLQFPIEKVTTSADKNFIVIQCVLGNISLYTSGVSLATDSIEIMKTATRVTKCLIDCAIYEQNTSKLKFSLQLYQSLIAKVWTNSALVLKQIRGIGQKKAKALAQSNIVNFKQIRECDPGKIEMILHRNPPFGVEMKKNVESIPEFILNIKQSLIPGRAQDSYDHIVLNINIKLANKEVAFYKDKLGCYCQFWVETNFDELIDFRRMLISKVFKNPQSIKLNIEVKYSNTEIYCHLQSENYVGIDVHETVIPKVNPRKYIDIAGASILPNPSSLVTPHTENTFNSHDFKDDDFFDEDIDPEQWKQIADTINNETTAINTTPSKPSPLQTKTGRQAPSVNEPSKKQTKSKRVRKNDDNDSSLKPKKQRKKTVKNKNKENLNPNTTVKPNNSTTEAVLPATSSNRSKICTTLNPQLTQTMTLEESVPPQAELNIDEMGTKTPEFEEFDINDDELYASVDEILGSMGMNKVERKNEQLNSTSPASIMENTLETTKALPKEHGSVTPLVTESNSKVAEEENQVTDYDFISSNDTVFATNEDDLFDNEKREDNCSTLTAWLERYVKIVPDEDEEEEEEILFAQQ